MRVKINSLSLLLFVIALSAHAQMRQIKTKYGQYDNGQLNPVWYTNYLYNSPQQIYPLESASYSKDSLGIFYNNVKSIITRDANSRPIQEIFLTWDGVQWINGSKLEYTYDFFGNTTRSSEFSWQFGNWVENLRNTKIFSSNNKILEEVYAQIINAQLTNNLKMEYEYDLQEKLINIYTLNWNNGINSWQNSRWLSHKYNGTTALLDTSFDYNWITNQSSYLLNGRYLYNYNASNQLITKLKQDINGNQIINNRKEEYQYHSSGNKSKYFKYDWANNVWFLRYEQENDYDVNGRRILYVTKDFNNNTMQVENTAKIIYTYDEDSTLLTTKNHGWVNNSWVEGSLYEYIFEPVQQLPLTVKEHLKINARTYPNPFTINTIIEFETPVSGITTIKIFSATGQLINEAKLNTSQGTNSWLWNGDDANGMALPQGMYVVQLHSTSQTNTFKIIKH